MMFSAGTHEAWGMVEGAIAATGVWFAATLLALAIAWVCRA